MDAPTPKRAAKFLTGFGSRRGMLRTAVTGAAASVLTGIGLISGTKEEAAAKNKKKRCKPKAVGAPCNSNKECCCQTNRICARPNAMTTSTVCCGTKSASCDTKNGNADCCFGFVCNNVTQKCEVTPT